MNEVEYLLPDCIELRVLTNRFPTSIRSWNIDINNLFNPARPWRENNNAIAKENGLFYAVRHENNRNRFSLPNADQFFLQRQSGLGIDGGKRLIHENDLRSICKSPRYRGTLLHPPGQFMRVLAFTLGKTGK